MSSYESEVTMGSNERHDTNKMHKVRVFAVGGIKNMDYCHIVDLDPNHVILLLITDIFTHVLLLQVAARVQNSIRV